MTDQYLRDFAKQAEVKLGERIKSHVEKTTHILEKIETYQPKDVVIRGKKLHFINNEVGEYFVNDEHLHNFAYNQVIDRSKVGRPFSTFLNQSDWGKQLLVQNLNTVYRNSSDNFLLRSVNNEVRGFLSDRYKRLDTRPLIAAFMQAIQGVGAVPYESHFTDTKIALKAVMPKVYRLSETEVITLGVIFSNSDFGNGPLDVSIFCERLICLNGMIASRDLRKVHLGSKLTENVAWSEKTLQYDTETTASAIGDIVQGQLQKDNLEKFLDSLKKADKELMEPNQIQTFLKKELSKERTEEVIDSFNSADIINLPAGQTRYRLSQAISFVANQISNEEEKLDLQRLAGTAVLKGVAV